MTPAQASRLLAIAAAFDQRTVGEADVAAWHDAVGDLNYDLAAQAVRRHYRDSRERIMPADVRRGVRSLLETQSNAVTARALEDARGSGVPLPPAIRSAFRMPTARVEPPDALERHVAMAQPCKFCGASPGRPCEIPGTGRQRTTPHPLRGKPEQESFPAVGA